MSAEDFSQIEVIDKKLNQSISFMKTSPNDTHVAIGDAHRNIAVFNAASREETNRFGYHTAKITGLDFSIDGT